MKIYHNPRCSKSRQALEMLQNATSNIEIIEYLKYPLKFREIKILLSQLNIEPEQLIRKNEKDWKENYKGKAMREDDIINAIIMCPNLMQRPIVTNGKKAIIGRPAENILEIFS
tara:strand:- start:29559 stop:29900 length:342 start_codon:yes stop_codon:yes gene_type:complete